MLKTVVVQIVGSWMRLVLLTAHSSEGEVQHRYVAHRLAQAFPDELVGIVVGKGVNRSLTEKAQRWWRRYSLREIASRLAVRAVHRATREDERKAESISAVLFPAGEDGRMPRRDILTEVASHNSKECLQLLEDLKPDIVVVYGTLIIGRKLISSLPKAINVHTGLSPRYRGSDTNFWPIYNKEPEFLGVTLHRLDPGVDSGAILARGRSALSGTENEHTVFARAVVMGADLLCNAIRREYRDEARPITQTLSEGREYRSVERTFIAEAKVRRLLKQGILRQGLAEWREEF
jgi:folate-dependent phosphoribosylglycinamide formyltransferase PurN